MKPFKKFLFLMLSLCVFLNVASSPAYALSPRTPDINRTYYSAERTSYAYYDSLDDENGDGQNDVILLYSITARYTWSVESQNPTIHTMVIDNVNIINETVYYPTLNGINKQISYGGIDTGLGYGSPSITVGFNTASGGSITLIQNALLYPNGAYHFDEYGGGNTRLSNNIIITDTPI